MNISGIKKYTGLNYKSIVRALEVLKYVKVIGEVDLSRSRSFRIRVENEKACAVKKLIRSLDSFVRAPEEGDKRVDEPCLAEARTSLTAKYKEPRVLAYTVE